MNFRVEGPFELRKTDRGLVAADARSRAAYWERVEESCSGLGSACGCYVFAIKAGRGILPWYVGKAEKQGFQKECLTPHKINHFNNAIGGRKGTAMLFFLPQITDAGKYRKPTVSKRPAIRELESLLIGMALTRNRELLNTKGTRMLKELTVDGFINSKSKGRNPSSASALRKLFGG